MNTNLLTNAERAANILKAFEPDELRKGGEGSKGGKVIGHTKSGKPVYESNHSINNEGNVVNNNKETQDNNQKFKHHRLLSAYHAGRAMTMVSVEKKKQNSPEVQKEIEAANQHAKKSKQLHNKKEHGNWLDTIPAHKDATAYGEKYYKENN